MKDKIKKGFTLIELLVVVLIIGILSAVALPQYQKAVEKTRLTEALAIGRHIMDLQQIYYLANNEYTTDFYKLGIDVPSGYKIVQGVPDTMIPNKGKHSFQLDNIRVIYYYYPGSLDLAFFFWYKNRKIQCYSYTEWGSKLCSSLPL